MSDIPPGDKFRILRSLDGYKEKPGVNGQPPKPKARIFVDGRGQLDELLGDTYSGVARIESLFAVAGICAHLGLLPFVIDNHMAYTEVVRPADAPYKYLLLQKDVTALLVLLQPGFAPFVRNDGSILVELTRMLYGEKNAGAMWYDLLVGEYNKRGFVINPVDHCVVRYEGPEGICIGVMTVDDTFFIASTPIVKEYTRAMYTSRFGVEGYAMKEGDHIRHLGMNFEFVRSKRQVVIDQKEFVKEFCMSAGITRSYRTPAKDDMFEPAEQSPDLSDHARENYRSHNMSLMYLATRTYPELLPVCAVLAGRFLESTEDDRSRLDRAIGYLLADVDHCLVIRPDSLNLVGSADCSYGVHRKGESHTGHCEGFKGAGDIPDSYFSFGSGRQTIPAKSSTEGELISGNKGAEALEWTSMLFDGLGFGPNSPAKMYRNRDISDYADEDCEVLDPVQVPVLYQDNKSAIFLAVMGRGNYRNTKHIRIRYYFIRDLVQMGRLIIEWVASSLMVADLLTKGVTLAVFLTLLPKLIGCR